VTQLSIGRCHTKCGTGMRANVQTHMTNKRTSKLEGAYIIFCEDAKISHIVKNGHLRVFVNQNKKPGSTRRLRRSGTDKNRPDDRVVQLLRSWFH
jgi:hypothetical protein